jgi:hypothetical protein
MRVFIRTGGPSGSMILTHPSHFSDMTWGVKFKIFMGVLKPAGCRQPAGPVSEGRTGFFAGHQMF